MQRANLYSRLATRILVQVAHAEISHEDDILDLARATPWERWFGAEQTLRVDTSAIKSPVQSLQYCNLRAKDGICDRLREREGERPDIDTVRPDARVHLFLTGHTATLYLDTSGESLFKRGWRLDKGEAPLRENLAAGMLALAGWDPAAAAGSVLRLGHHPDRSRLDRWACLPASPVLRLRAAARHDPDIDTVRPDARVHLFPDRPYRHVVPGHLRGIVFKRGWRLDKGEAPLRENLAAGMLALAGWDPAAPLLDPFCGSGHHPDRSRLDRAGRASRHLRPGFERLRGHDPRWRDLKDARARILPQLDAPLVGYDLDPQAIRPQQRRARLADLGLDPFRSG